MTTDNENTEPATTDDAPARRAVPNVRPSAISGLDHELLNPDDAAAAEKATAEPEEDASPARTAEEALDWVKDSDDYTERGRRADQAWQDAGEEGQTEEWATALRTAVGDDLDVTTSTSEEIAAWIERGDPNEDVKADRATEARNVLSGALTAADTDTEQARIKGLLDDLTGTYAGIIAPTDGEGEQGPDTPQQ